MYVRQASMAGGEIAPSMWGRTDLAKYLISLARCRGGIITPTGAWVNRPGTKYIAEVKNSTKRVRLLTFKFGGDQNFALEFGEQYIRFYKDGGRVLQSIAAWSAGISYSLGDYVTYGGQVYGSLVDPNLNHQPDISPVQWVLTTAPVYEISTPYLAADLAGLRFTQNGDVVTITSPSYAPRELRRITNTNWTLTAIGFWNDPAPVGASMGISAAIAEAAGPIARFAVTAVYADGRESFPRITHAVQYPANTAVGLQLPFTDDMAPVEYRVYRAWTDFITNHVLLTFDYIGSIKPALAGTIPPYGGSGPSLFTAAADGTRHPPMWSNPFVGSPTAWAQNTSYKVGARVTANGNTYECIWAGKSATTGTGPAATVGVIRDGPAYRVPAKAYNVGDKFEIFGMIATVSIMGVSAADTHTLSWATGHFQDGTMWYDIVSAFGDPLEGAVYWKYVQAGTAPSTYPIVAAHFEQRKVYGNTPEKPYALWLSKVGSFNNFDQHLPVLDSDPIVALRLDSVLYEEIRWLLPLRALLSGTTEAVWLISGSQGANDVLTSSSFRARPQTYRGAGGVPPIIVGNSALVVSPLGNVVHDLLFDFMSDSYKSNDLTVMATHLFEGHQIVEWAYAPYPYNVDWAVREDGVLLGLTYVREHEIVAWHWHDTQGSFESICAVKEGNDYGVYVAVNRTINGLTKRYIERFASRILPKVNGVSDAKQGVFLDAALTYSGALATQISGLNHLEGMQVMALADGNVLGPYVVQAGAINISADMPDGAALVTVGLAYTSEIETLDVAPQAAQDTRSRLKRVVSALFEVVESRGLKIGTSYDKLVEWQQRTVAGSYGPVPVYTGSDLVRVPGTFNRGGRIILRQDQPLPVTVTGVLREVEFDDQH